MVGSSRLPLMAGVAHSDKLIGDTGPMKQIVKRGVLMVVILGVLIGTNRWLGGGQPLFSDGWFASGTQKLAEAQRWGAGLLIRIAEALT